MSAANYLVHGGHLTHFGHRNIIKYCNRPFECFENGNNGNVVTELDRNGQEQKVIDVEQHDDVLIKNINDVVQPEDMLYHLGDFSFGRIRGDKTNNAKFYLDRIKCKNIVLITGNHDPHYDGGQARPEFAQLFKAAYDQLRIKVWINGTRQEIVLNHYAMRVWNKSHYGTWQLYGHSHYSLHDDPNALSLDVGVDAVAGRATGKTYAELQKHNRPFLANPLEPSNYRPICLQEIHKLMSTKSFIPIDHHRGANTQSSPVTRDWHGRQEIGSTKSK